MPYTIDSKVTLNALLILVVRALSFTRMIIFISESEPLHFTL